MGKKYILKLDDFEYRVLVNVLNSMRNKLIQEAQYNDALDSRRLTMEKYITDERTGLRYELIGDIYYLAGDDEPEVEQEPIGIWGQRHLLHIKEHKKALYSELVMTGKLNSYLADIDRQAEDMLLNLMEEMAEREGVTEQLKSDNQMEWVAKTNCMMNQAVEIVNDTIIYI